MPRKPCIGCGLKTPHYGFAHDQRPRWCGGCKPSDAIMLRKLLCLDCKLVAPHYGYPENQYAGYTVSPRTDFPNNPRRWCGKCAKNHAGAEYLENKNMCEECGLKHAGYGLLGDVSGTKRRGSVGKKRWCGACAKKYPDAVAIQAVMVKRKQVQETRMKRGDETTYWVNEFAAALGVDVAAMPNNKRTQAAAVYKRLLKEIAILPPRSYDLTTGSPSSAPAKPEPLDPFQEIAQGAAAAPAPATAAAAGGRQASPTAGNTQPPDDKKRVYLRKPPPHAELGPAMIKAAKEKAAREAAAAARAVKLEEARKQRAAAKAVAVAAAAEERAKQHADRAAWKAAAQEAKQRAKSGSDGSSPSLPAWHAQKKLGCPACRGRHRAHTCGKFGDKAKKTMAAGEDSGVNLMLSAADVAANIGIGTVAVAVETAASPSKKARKQKRRSH